MKAAAEAATLAASPHPCGHSRTIAEWRAASDCRECELEAARANLAEAAATLAEAEAEAAELARVTAIPGRSIPYRAEALAEAAVFSARDLAAARLLVAAAEAEFSRLGLSPAPVNAPNSKG